jgi:hypothetical protein
MSDETVAWLEPTKELRFIERDGSIVLQQKWSASGEKWDRGDKLVETRWRWKDVPLDLNPESDCC